MVGVQELEAQCVLVPIREPWNFEFGYRQKRWDGCSVQQQWQQVPVLPDPENYGSGAVQENMSEVVWEG